MGMSGSPISQTSEENSRGWRSSNGIGPTFGSTGSGKKLADDSILFMANIQMYWDRKQVGEGSAMIIQGIWNLRDQFKAKGATLVLLTTSGTMVLTELAEDVLVLDEPLPTAEDLAKIVDQIFADAKVTKPKKRIDG
jgi:hypothetical protein